MLNAPRLDRKNFHALMRLDENRAKCQLALKAERFYTSITNTVVWGNHSTTQARFILDRSWNLEDHPYQLALFQASTPLAIGAMIEVDMVHFSQLLCYAVLGY